MAGTKIKKRQIENLQIGDIDVAASANIAISKIAGLQAELDGKETAFSKNTAFNKNFGTIAGTVAEGDHTHAFGALTGIPTTIVGYGIADAYTKSEIDGFTVKLTGAQTVAGVKTFSAIPVLPATNPTLANQAARKGYVDSLTGTLSSLNTTDKTNLVNAINEIWTDYVPESRHIDTAIGLLGGGDISTDRLIEIDWSYMDNRYLTGLKDHEVVRIMADANVVLSGTQTIQGIALIVGDRVLLTGQTDPAENGAYVVQSSTWVRTPDFDEVGPGEIEQGARFGVAEGTYIGTAWTLSTGGTITLGTTPLDFFQSNAGASYTPGEGIVFNGTEIAALVNEALWNANQIRGINVVSAAPAIGQLMRYNGASWAPWTPDFASASALDNYYTKTQLQTAGQSQVYWRNINGLANNVVMTGDQGGFTPLYGGDLDTITGTNINYVIKASAALNTPSWATTDGIIISSGGSGNGMRQLWFGRLGEVGTRAMASGEYEEWIQLATQGWVAGQNYLTQASLDNYVTLDGTQTITGTKTFNNVVRTSQPATDNVIRNHSYLTVNGSIRWGMGLFGAETGNDAGSTFVLSIYSDAGAYLRNAFSVIRSTGVTDFKADPTVNGNTIWHEGNLNPADYLLDTSPAGSITTQNITDWNTGLTDIAALEQDVLAINQDIAAIETELDGTVSQTNYIVREALTGAKDGVNKAFILANAPVAGKEMIFLNGQLLQEGTTADYTISGATVTLTANQAAPVSDDVILGTYIY